MATAEGSAHPEVLPPPRPQPRPFVVRRGTPEDEGFVAKSWAETFRGSEGWVKCIEKPFFARAVFPAIEAILKSAEVRIVGPPDDDTTIYGFAVFEPDTLHMVYTRTSWRRMGVCRALLEGLPLSEMHWSTQSGDFLSWMRFKQKMKSYRPFWMRQGELSHG